MKLRVRVNKQTSRVELEGPEPTLSQLSTRVKEDVLPSAGISADTEFTLSLNGREPLVDTGQTLFSCGVVSGDMISVILPQSSAQNPSSVADQRRDARADALRDTGGTSSPSTNRAEDPEMEMVVGHFTPQPMLCGEAEDGTVPHSLETLYQNARCRSKVDCLVLAAHVLMLETGFQPQGSDVRSAEMPGGWRADGGVHRLQYTHPHCEGSLAHVVAVQMGQLVVIHGILKTSGKAESTRKLELRADTFVTEQWADGNPGVAYRDLQKLSRLFKDQLSYPLIATAREALGLPALFGLSVLPPELLLRILRLLDVHSVLTLSAVCKHLYNTVQDSSLWKHLLHRDFRVDLNHNSTSWKELYKDRYKIRRSFRTPRIWPPLSTHPINPMPMPPLPIPIFPPGIIGGEHDQRPAFPQGILPRPRYDPIGPLGGLDPGRRFPVGRRPLRPGGDRATDIRRGFI